MFCTKCGTKNPEKSANCYNCGQKIAATSDSSQLRSDNEVIGPTNVDTRKLANELQDRSDSLKTQNGRQAALYAPMHLFFFTAVDRNQVTRFFDVMQDEGGFSVAETATSAPRLGQCVETVYGAPGGTTLHHVHRLYGRYPVATTATADQAMHKFADVLCLTQVIPGAETLNQMEAIPTWTMIFQKLHCPTFNYSFKNSISFSN